MNGDLETMDISDPLVEKQEQFINNDDENLNNRESLITDPMEEKREQLPDNNDCVLNEEELLLFDSEKLEQFFENNHKKFNEEKSLILIGKQEQSSETSIECLVKSELLVNDDEDDHETEENDEGINNDEDDPETYENDETLNKDEDDPETDELYENDPETNDNDETLNDDEDDQNKDKDKESQSIKCTEEVNIKNSNGQNANELQSDDDNASYSTVILDYDEDANVNERLKNHKQNSEDENSSTSSSMFTFTSDSDDSKRFDRSRIVDVDKIGNQTGMKYNPAIGSEIYEIKSDNSDNDGFVVTSTEKMKTPIKMKMFKKTIPNSELRRSSRAVNRIKYTDGIEEIDDESDPEDVIIEELPQKSFQPKKIAIKNLTKSKSISVNTNMARGSSATSAIPKNKTKVTVTQVTLPIEHAEPILPTLTDDMFVVESPSFIVPYVYEKPAITPLKEFVDNLGMEIEEEKARVEKELKEKQKTEKAQREKEKQEKRERGEVVPDSEEEDKKETKKAEKKERRRRKKEDDDVSWDGSGSESDDESISDDDSQKGVTGELPDVPEISAIIPKTDSYFGLTLGKFFMDIGKNLVQEYVQIDLVNQQNKKLRREKRAGHNTEERQTSVSLLKKNLEMSQKTNEPFKFTMKSCKFCDFKTESALALGHHFEIPHMKNNKYSCNFCQLQLPNQYNMLSHVQEAHGVSARYEPRPALNQCTHCPFEVQGKGKLGRHLTNCIKRFKPDTNLSPPIDWEYPAKIPKINQTRAPVPYHTAQFARLSDPSTSGGQSARVPVGLTFRPRIVLAPTRTPGILIKQAMLQQAIADAKKPNHSITIGPSRMDGVIHTHGPNNLDTRGIVMCEICDGYIRDLEQLRNHMQWVHKVKIHPKMIYNRPPLNCQKCQARFFTDQGLERHLLGVHGLVTSAIQESANKGKDAGRCPICGRAYQKNLLAHVALDHELTLKPANLSYKCTVCNATFDLYRDFENHVYSAHSAVVKKDMKKATLPVKGKVNNNNTPNSAAAKEE